MIEPVAATALILSILALVAYYLQPEQPHHQHHYYHQVRRARVMSDPQRRTSGDGMVRAAEGREGGRDWVVYEQENEEREGEDEGREEVAIGVRELRMMGRGDGGSRLVLEEVVDVGDENKFIPATECVVEVASTHKARTHAVITPLASTVPVIRLTIPDSDTPSSILSSHDVDDGVNPEGCYSNTLDQQRRQRVRFDEALRMHSYGGSQYVGRVVDRDVQRRTVETREREAEEEMWVK